MGSENQNNTYWIERLGIFFTSAVYLLIFNVNLPNGDALRIVRQIEASDLAWNPNHLLLDSFGYYWYGLLERLGFDITPLASFEVITFVSTIISLLLFHAVLVAAGINGWITRIIAVVALFASKSFLSLAVTQYYFMMQMPFLLGAMIYSIRFLKDSEKEAQRSNYLYIIGVLLAIATGIEVNNVLLVFALGIVMAVTYQNKLPWNWVYTAKLWGAAAAIGFPLFIFGYVASGHDKGFLSWLLSYAGANNSAMEEMYGLQWTPKGIAVSAARTGYNLFFGNIIESAGLGTVLKVVAFGETFEFIPGTFKMTLALLLMPIVGLFQLFVFIWVIRRIKVNPLFLFLLVWIAAYLLFAFFWNNGSNIFWFQTLPAIVLIFCIYVSRLRETSQERGRNKIFFWQTGVLAVIVPLLFIINTLQTVIPVTFTDIEKYQREYAAMVQKNDLVIVPGWDKYKWMSDGSKHLDVQKIMLMNMALNKKNDQQYIGNLKILVARQLSAGNRVIVGRLYDLDSELRPWYGLTHMGWPRDKVKSLLSAFCNRKLAKIDDVVFREIYFCAK